MADCTYLPQAGIEKYEIPSRHPSPQRDCVIINERPLRLQDGTGGQVTKL
jgi:hypothetical protein